MSLIITRNSLTCRLYFLMKLKCLIEHVSNEQSYKRYDKVVICLNWNEIISHHHLAAF